MAKRKRLRHNRQSVATSPTTGAAEIAADTSPGLEADGDVVANGDAVADATDAAVVTDDPEQPDPEDAEDAEDAEDDTEPEPDAEAEAEPEPEQSDPEDAADAEDAEDAEDATESEPDAEAEAEPEPEQSDPEDAADAEAEAEPEPQQSDPEDAEDAEDAEDDTEPEPDAEPEAEPEPQGVDESAGAPAESADVAPVPEPDEPELEGADESADVTADESTDVEPDRTAPTSDAPDATTEAAATTEADADVVETEPAPAESSKAPRSPAAYLIDDLGDPVPDSAPADEAMRGSVDGVAAWRRLLRMGRPRATKANVLGALLAVALGVGIATQVQLTNERGLSELSQTELVRVLNVISQRTSRLDDQIRDLEAQRDRLRSGTGTTGEALEQAQGRADTLGILAGTIPARGTGITLSITDADRKISGPVVLDLIQELRDAGAEAIEVGGVRVVASSFVGDQAGDLSIDGVPVSRPLLVKAIGDSNTLASAMSIPGGIIETVRQKGASASVIEEPSVTITSLHTPVEPTHAKVVE